jgi:hypothetical protein
MLATLLVAFSALLLLGGLVVLGRRRVGYSHLKHTISELGEVGSPDQKLASLGLFLPVGLLSLAAAALTASVAPPVSALALAIATGYITAAAFPCDRGSPLSGSTRQAAHNVGGGIQYVGGAFALLTIANRVEQPFKAAGFVVLAATLVISLLPSTSIRGAVQRLAEATLFACLLLSASSIARSAA